MNARERFLAIMNFDPAVRSLKWEFGYWGKALNNWYEQGLPRVDYPVVDKRITTPTSSLYNTAWTCGGTERLPDGIAVMAGGLYWPTQGFPLDHDVKRFFGMDETQRLVDVNLHFCPMFDVEVLEEDKDRFTYMDVDGVKRVYLKEESTIPTSLDWPIKDWASWEKLKAERLNPDKLSDRFPENWPELVKE